MPCCESASGSCDRGMLLRCATSCRALFSASSGTFSPARLARWAWISCSTSRSSTCWRRTFCGGSSSFWARSRSPIVATWSSSSLLRTTPSFTTAATRSSSTPLVASSRVWACASPCPCRARNCPAVTVANATSVTIRRMGLPSMVALSRGPGFLGGAVRGYIAPDGCS